MKPHLLLIIGILLAFGRMGAMGQNQHRPAQQARGFVTVQVTGKGESLELAQEDAKRNALARVVGQAIKARTDITEDGNDAKVISQFIAASAGFIAKYDETATSNENGIFTVTANVTVYGERLLEAVTFGNDSFEAAKEMQQARLGSDLEATREAMTKYICSYLLDYCRIWSIVPKELVPGYDNNGQPVLHANCYFGTTPQRYQMYTRRLENAMARVGAREAPWKYELTKSHMGLNYFIRPDDPSNSVSKGRGLRYLWISRKFLESTQVFESEFKKYGYKMTVKLLDENGNAICSQQFGFQFDKFNYLPYPGCLFLGALKGDTTDVWKSMDSSCYRRKCNITFTNFASSEEMLKAKRLVAFVEPVKKVREPTLNFRQFLNGAMRWGWYEH